MPKVAIGDMKAPMFFSLLRKLGTYVFDSHVGDLTVLR